MIQELWRILNEMGGVPDDWGDPHFQHHQGYYESVPLSTDNFTPFSSTGEEDKVVCCVDGGNNCIYRSPIDSLHLIRIYFNLFKGRTRSKNVKPLNAFLTVKQGYESIECRIRPIESYMPISETEFILNKEDLGDGNGENAGRIIRTYLEWDTMSHVVEKHLDEGDMLVKDGVLQTSVEGEKEHSDRLYGLVEKHNINLVGVAKSCSLKTTMGHPLISAVRFIGDGLEEDLWYYHPLAINKNPDHKGDMAIVKYHPRSEYVFRTEFYEGVDMDKKEVLGHLANQAKDPLFLGYPYGLVDADMKARVTDEETRHLRRAGTDRMRKEVSYRIKALDAHDRLSNL